MLSLVLGKIAPYICSLMKICVVVLSFYVLTEVAGGIQLRRFSSNRAMSENTVEDGKDARFDIGLVLESFKRCGDESGGRLSLDDYIAGYIELNK